MVAKRFSMLLACAGTALLSMPGSAQHAPTGKVTRIAPAAASATPVDLSPSAASGLTRAYGGLPIDVTQFHYDAGRTGWNATETDLTPASVKAGGFGLIASLTVDGNVLAQPLLVTGYAMPDGTKRDVLVIATGNNSVYAYDAKSYKLLYRVNLGRAQPSADVDCDDVMPTYGISGTPVIVRQGAKATIYLIAATEPTQGEFHSRLHALDLGTGQDVKTPAEIMPQAKLNDGSTIQYDPRNQWTRTGLAVANGSIYFGAGSHCDNKSTAITGWILRYGLDLTPQGAFNTIGSANTEALASIWMTAFAPAIDPRNNLWVASGNGPYGPSTHDFGETVLSLTPGLARHASFTPSNWLQLNDHDLDQGSGGVMLLPHVTGQTGPDLAVQIGKTGILYVLNQAAPGGLTPTDNVYAKVNAGSGVWGGPAYFAGPKGRVILEQGDMDVLKAYAVPSAGGSLKLTAHGTSQAGYGGSMPIVSSNGSLAATGVVWLVRRSAPIELEAYNAEKLGAPIYHATIGQWSNTKDNNSFLSAMEANGRVYVGAYKVVKVFGLTK